MFLRIALAALFLFAGPTLGQSGLRVPQQGEPGLDPTFARGWLAPDFDRYGFAMNHWRETVGFAPGQRMSWSYSLSDRSALGMGMGSGYYLDEQRALSVYGRYSLTPNWALSAETMSRGDPADLLQLRDFRIGVQRRF